MTATPFHFLLYRSEDETVSVQAVVRDETLWLTQAAMVSLFQVGKSTISRHLKHIFETGELNEKVVVAFFATTTPHGALQGRTQVRRTAFYNLDAIISVGYRVNSARATHFRIWATSVLKEYITKGFALDDERLKQGKAAFGKDYFRELLERVRSIRTSERRIWQQITDIFAECSTDYTPNAQVTRNFYAMVQNKFHYAITGHTAAEIIHSSADHRKPAMGLTTWKHAPDGRILKSDVVIAKNYLLPDQIRQLELSVEGFFNYIEGLILRRRTFTMQAFAQSVDAFLSFQQYRILEGKGTVSSLAAKRKAIAEYDIFNKTQPIISDFDRSLQQLTQQMSKQTSERLE